MYSKKNCPHCGKSLTKKENDDELVLTFTPENEELQVKKEPEQLQLSDELVQQVVTEVLKKIDPLLIKLKEIAGQQQAANQRKSPGTPQEQQQLQLQQMHANMQERLKAREQVIALRMKKMQRRPARK